MAVRREAEKKQDSDKENEGNADILGEEEDGDVIF
jgi:hypothetical protein